MRSRILLAAASLLLVGALAAPASAFAATGGGGTSFGTISITIGHTARLHARLIADVRVTITCTPPTGALSVDSTSFFVQMAEAVGNSVALGNGTTPNATFACDGHLHRYTIQVGPPNVPFKRGPAVVSVSAQACGTLKDSSPGCTGVNTPWVVIKLR